MPPPLLPLGNLFADRRGGEPLIGAHRGAGRYAPENTLAAFAEGIRLGADLLELDVHLSRDGHAVVIHDHTVDRTTDGAGFVHDLSLADLRRLDAGAPFAPRFAGAQIPTLAEVVDAVAGRAGLTIELKGWPATGTVLVDAVLEVIERMGAVDGVLVIAFDHESVRRLKQRNQRVATAVNYGGRLLDPVHAGRAAGADVLNQSWLYCDRDFCAVAHRAGFAVQCLAPSPSVAWDLTRNGVDIVDADEPDLIKAATRAGVPRPPGPSTIFLESGLHVGGRPVAPDPAPGLRYP